MALRRSAVPSVLLALTTSIGLVLGVTAAPAAGRAASTAVVTVNAASVPTTGFKAVDISARDGVILKANVISPTTQGRHPAIVFVNSWGLNDAEYLVQAKAFAEHGYVVLSYTTR